MFIARISNPSRLLYNKGNLLTQFNLNKLYSTEDPPIQNKSLGYAKAFEKFEHIKDDSDKSIPQNFTYLLRNSRLMDLGDPEGKIVSGKIFHVVNDDLYIDFGWKFHCVCPRPKKNASNYIKGAKVRLVIKSLELSSKFLGFEKDLTLLEADCQLIGIMQERGSNLYENKNTQ